MKSDMESEERVKRSGAFFKRVIAVVVGVVVVGQCSIWGYGCIPKRELAAAEDSFARTPCKPWDSISPPDQNWNDALLHAHRAALFPGYADDASHLERQISFSCTSAHMLAEMKAEQRATEAMNNATPGQLHDPGDWKRFVSDDDRTNLCNPEWRRCDYAPEFCKK